MVVTQDFKEFIELLNKHEVHYLVVGGYAVAFHGNPRYTKDLDLWIWLNSENVKKLIKVINEFGLGSLGLKTEDFMNPEDIIQFGYPPNRIDIIMDTKGVNFQECYQKRVESNIDGIKVNFIDLECLRKNKKAIGRYQDLADLENLD